MLLLTLDPKKQVSTEGTEGRTHILDLEASDPNADYWFMLCGLRVRTYDNGDLDPSVDFYCLDRGHLADCSKCLQVLWQGHG